MYWRRIVIFSMSFQCCYPDKYGIPQLDRPAINDNVEYKKDFGNRFEMEETGALNIWSDRESERIARRIADYQCEELRFNPDSACNIEITVADTMEEVEEIPKYMLDTIDYLEERYKEAESIDEKMALRDEINAIKRRYGKE